MPNDCDSLAMNLHAKLDMLQMSKKQSVHMIACKWPQYQVEKIDWPKIPR